MDSFVALYKRLLKIDLFGIAGEPLPSKQALLKSIKDGALLMPNAM